VDPPIENQTSWWNPHPFEKSLDPPLKPVNFSGPAILQKIFKNFVIKFHLQT
jgi:hypothetical protein